MEERIPNGLGLLLGLCLGMGVPLLLGLGYLVMTQQLATSRIAFGVGAALGMGILILFPWLTR
jgi:hypothetical protein